MSDLIHQGVFTPHLMVNALRRLKNQPVLIDSNDSTVFTAADIRDITSQYVQALEGLQISVGCRIGILSYNRPEVLHVLNACMFAGACSVPLHPLGGIDDYCYVADDANLEALVFDPADFSERARELQSRAPGIRKLLSLGPCAFATNLCEVAAAIKPQELSSPMLDGNEVYRLAYSGGTTGKPKAIMSTHRSSLELLRIQLLEWEWPAEVRQLICSPLSHAGSTVFAPTLMLSGSVVVLPRFDPLLVMQAIEKHRITCMLVVPTMIYSLLDHPRREEFDLSSLETVFYGSSSIAPTRLREAIEKLGPIFFQFYGQSEAPMTVTVLRKREHDIRDLNRLASCGRPVPWVHVALLDDEDQPVVEGAPGEICVRGPLVMTGYLNKPEQTAEAFVDGWLHTGDIATRDADGFLRIVDRSKDMIISGGFNVFPREVEDALAAHPAVLSCAVVGIPDDRWGEAVTAVVVLRAGALASAEELIAFVRSRKGAVHAPKSVLFVDALPLTAVGKVDKKELRARFVISAK